MLIILLFILLLNVVGVTLIYYSLTGLEKKGRLMFVAVGIAIMYMITLFIYWISTKSLNVSENIKNIIMFLFVPINSIIVLPIIAKSYVKYKLRKLKSDKLRNRLIFLAIPFVIILIIECSYFSNIQSKIEKYVEQNSNSIKNTTINNTQTNNNLENEVNAVESNIIDDNQKEDYTNKATE